MAVQQDAVRVAALRDAPQCRHTSGINISVGTTSGSLAAKCRFSTRFRIVAESMSGFDSRSLIDA
jgi:hypothetical protein